MSIYDKASLVLIPSGTKTSKVYSQKPVSGDGDFTFSRSTAATRVNADGNIEKETQNLLLYSNTFSNANWTKSNAVVVGGQAGYDGSNDAWKVTSSAAGTPQLSQSGSSSLMKTHSIYAKAGNVSTLKIWVGATKEFDLSAGTTSSSNSKITDVGNGWYRCEVFSIFLNMNPFYSASAAGEFIYIQDAQQNYGLVAQDYIETTTTAVEGGITDNVPRLDYTDSSCPALLLEPQRTNLVPHSEYFGDWGTFRSSLTANNATSPENYTNSYKLIQQSGETTSGGVFKGISVSTSTTYTYSFFAKAAGYNWCYARVIHSSDNFYAWFDLDNGVVGNTTGSGVTSSIENYGSGWYKCSITYTSTTTLSNLHIYIADTNGSGTLSNPDGVKGINIYGATLEEGSYATSYIPTYGSAVTRNGESCLGAGDANTFNSTEGVLYWEGSFDSTSTIAGAVALINSAGGDRVQLYNSGSSLVALVQVDGVTSFTANTSGSVDIITNHKYAIKWALNDFAFWVDGVEIATDTSGATFSSNTLDELRFSDFGANYLYANTKQVLTFNTALSDTELADLTTL